jgi:hypothetical protein
MAYLFIYFDSSADISFCKVIGFHNLPFSLHVVIATNSIYLSDYPLIVFYINSNSLINEKRIQSRSKFYVFILLPNYV